MFSFLMDGFESMRGLWNQSNNDTERLEMRWPLARCWYISLKGMLLTTLIAERSVRGATFNLPNNNEIRTVPSRLQLGDKRLRRMLMLRHPRNRESRIEGSWRLALPNGVSWCYARTEVRECIYSTTLTNRLALPHPRSNHVTTFSGWESLPWLQSEWSNLRDRTFVRLMRELIAFYDQIDNAVWKRKESLSGFHAISRIFRFSFSEKSLSLANPWSSGLMSSMSDGQLLAHFRRWNPALSSSCVNCSFVCLARSGSSALNRQLSTYMFSFTTGTASGKF